MPTHVDEVSKLQVTGEGSSFTCDTLHQATVTSEDYILVHYSFFGVRCGLLTICEVINEVVTFLVVSGGHVSLSNTQTDGVSETLTERSGSDFNTIGVSGLRVTRGQGVDLTERL